MEPFQFSHLKKCHLGVSGSNLTVAPPVFVDGSRVKIPSQRAKASLQVDVGRCRRPAVMTAKREKELEVGGQGIHTESAKLLTPLNKMLLIYF